MGAKAKVPALCDIGVLTLQQEGEDSVREPPTAAAERKMRKSLLRPMLRRRPTTSNADKLDAVLASAEGTPLHWTPFLSVGSKREDLQLMLEIFLGRLIDSGKFDLWPNRFLLARSLNWSSRVVCSRLGARAYQQQQTSATYARSSAGPRIHYLDVPQKQPSSARHVCSVNRLVGAV